MSDDILKATRVNLLADFYQSLLTKTQAEYLQLYYGDDYSLGEIAELHHVSRQAVYDNLKRTVTSLENYEERLHLYRDFQVRGRLVTQLQQIVQTKYAHDSELTTIIQKLAQCE
ncbi:putative DNA-binding protein [Lactobacillus sp. DCY120]|uniref:UPF0122 protein HU830_07445 n=1 Tax=Bombilactobacillus apium TaxID=2675299 RepID=A0A850QYR2_9LACO|nr:putative DNA-binding protein [Bombilactobacillus apium]NVY96984.1 putative DNA-binding protein [Bombilactobacillus apium]